MQYSITTYNTDACSIVYQREGVYSTGRVFALRYPGTRPGGVGHTRGYVQSVLIYPNKHILALLREYMYMTRSPSREGWRGEGPRAQHHGLSAIDRADLVGPAVYL